jgi:hypothetical protein
MAKADEPEKPADEPTGPSFTEFTLDN